MSTRRNTSRSKSSAGYGDTYNYNGRSNLSCTRDVRCRIKRMRKRAKTDSAEVQEQVLEREVKAERRSRRHCLYATWQRTQGSGSGRPRRHLADKFFFLLPPRIAHCTRGAPVICTEECVSEKARRRGNQRAAVNAATKLQMQGFEGARESEGQNKNEDEEEMKMKI